MSVNVILYCYKQLILNKFLPGKDMCIPELLNLDNI